MLTNIYNAILNELFSFSQLKTVESKKRWLRDRNLQVPSEFLTSPKELYDYLHPNENIHCECGSPLKFKQFNNKRSSYQITCSPTCLYKQRSRNMIGDKNSSHKVSKERRLEIGKENGIRLKRMISDGTFTPCVTNSWARSRCIVKVIKNGKVHIVKSRSSWDAYFQLYNPQFEYEKIRIPYSYDGSVSNYIVDFVDTHNKVLYEIKPDAFRESEKNIAKFNAAAKWSADNNYSFVIIGNLWFMKNYKESLLDGQPDELKIKRLLKQFNVI